MIYLVERASGQLVAASEGSYWEKEDGRVARISPERSSAALVRRTHREVMKRFHGSYAGQALAGGFEGTVGQDSDVTLLLQVRRTALGRPSHGPLNGGRRTAL